MPNSVHEWDARHRSGAEIPGGEPAAFLRETLPLLPQGRALDLAMGAGGNALFLAEHGWRVTGVDWSAAALEKAGNLARSRGVSVEAEKPAGRRDRQASPGLLLVLADLAGGAWPLKSRQAAEDLTLRSEDRSPMGALLLDILIEFLAAKADRLFSRDLVFQLNHVPDRPWLENVRGNDITELWLGRQLRAYGIQSRTLRIGEARGKGYWREDFREVFARYIPKSESDALRAEWREEAAAATAHAMTKTLAALEGLPSPANSNPAAAPNAVNAVGH
jgi:SAM-dependent methyltransferase